MDIRTHSNLEEFKRTFQDYVEYNRRDMEELRQKSLRKLVIELYKSAKEEAPTKAEIESKVNSLGWRVVKKGTPEQWGVRAMKDLPKVNMRGMKKAEREAEKARRKAAIDSMDSQAKMQAFVIRKRAHHIGYMATAYALAARLMNFAIGRLPALHAGAIVDDDGTRTSITAYAGGIADVDARTGFVARAIEATVADMRKYIYERQQSGRQRLKR